MRGSRIVAGIVVALALIGMARSAEAQAYRRWYLAEGAANGFFNDTILIGNPNATAAGTPRTHVRARAAREARTRTPAATGSAARPAKPTA